MSAKTPGLPAETLRRLRAIKLRALVQAQWAVDGPTGSLPGGATLHDAAGGRVFVLIDDGAVTGFGAGLAWAQAALSKRDSGDRGRDGGAGAGAGWNELHVLVERSPGGLAADAGLVAAGVVARRAAQFLDNITTWVVDGRSVTPAEPTPPDVEGSIPAWAGPLVDILLDHGVEPVAEHGILKGEVAGLEVARAVNDGFGPRLAVGVGRRDQETRAQLRPGEPVDVALEDVVRVVRQWRRPGVRSHPANLLARPRWLRANLAAEPGLVGAATLHSVADPAPVVPGLARSLQAPRPAGLAGERDGGEPLVVVCSTGIDVDLVPAAADYRLADGRDAALVLVVPEGDDHPLTRRLAGRLRRPAELRAVSRAEVGLPA